MRIEAFPQTIIDKLNKPGCEKESTSFSSKLENLLKMDKVTLKGQYHGGKIIFLFFFCFQDKTQFDQFHARMLRMPIGSSTSQDWKYYIKLPILLISSQLNMLSEK